MFGRQLRLFELLGFEVKIDTSWLFLALLITWSLAQGYFPGVFEDLPPATYWWMGVSGAMGLFLSIIFHEMSHSLIARRYGLPIRGITLFLFGGVAEMEDEPPSPKAEFFMAVAGPLASILLAMIFYALAAWARSRNLPVPIIGVTQYLGLLNTVLAVFNVVPAFPLDGGRVLRAGLWYWTGDLRAATRVASRFGTAFGFALIFVGVMNIVTGNFVGGMWLSLLGVFVWSAATASYYQMIARRALEGEPVRRFMSERPMTVSPRISVQELLEDYAYQYYYDFFPVIDDSVLLGCVATRQIKEVPRDRWRSVSVGEIMSPCSAANTIDVDEDALKAMSVMQRTGSSRMMVTENGHLVGIIVLKDLLRLLALKIDLEGLD